MDAFVRPLHPQYNKNVWENCAKVLAEKSDEILDIFLSDLINWIRDINSPGAIIILERLKKVPKIDRLVSIVNESVHLAELANNYEWLNNLSGLLDNEKLRKELSGNTVKILEEYYNN